MILRLNARRMKILSASLAAICACALLVLRSKEVSSGVKSGMELCLGVLIPSLFPFMALSSYIAKSGLCEKLSRPLDGLARIIFGLGGSLVPVILMSLIGGYPVGASGIAALYERGAVSGIEAKRAALFAVCAGPGFMISYIGSSLYGSAEIGAVMLGAMALSAIILGILSRFFYRESAERCRKASDAPKQSGAAVSAAYDAAKGMLGICAAVTLFSALTEAVVSLTGEGAAADALSCLLEVCSAVNKLSNNSPIELVAFAAGFGGLCVHFQIFSALGRVKVSKALFFLFRIMQGLLTALFSHLGIALLKPEAAVFSSKGKADFGFFNGSVLSGAVLLALCACFLFTLKSNKDTGKR